MTKIYYYNEIVEVAMRGIIELMGNFDFQTSKGRKSIIDRMKKDGRPIVIYGSGRFAQSVAEMCLENELDVFCFLDFKEYWFQGKHISVFGENIKCLLQKELPTKLDFNLLLGVIDYSKLEAIKKQFSGCKFIEYLDAVKPHIMPLEFINSNSKTGTNLYDLYDNLKDKESKDVLLAYLYARITGDVEMLARLNHSSQSLYDWELLDIKKDDVIIDGGAFTGDSIKEIKTCYGYIPNHIFAFEPDTDNLIKLLNAFSPEDLIKIHPIPAGLYSKDVEMKFIASGSSVSMISVDGEKVVPVQALDSHDAYKSVSLIKMDIEGCELEALKGAENLIRHNHPRLAICIYHRNEDIVEIYSYLKQFGYHFYMRQHAYSDEETVLYAL